MIGALLSRVYLRTLEFFETPMYKWGTGSVEIGARPGRGPARTGGERSLAVTIARHPLGPLR